MVRDEHPLRVLLPPTERTTEAVVAMEDAGLAGRRLGGQQRRPAIELHLAGPDQVRDEGNTSSANLVSQDRLGQAIDLDDYDTRLVGFDAIGILTGELGYEGAV